MPQTSWLMGEHKSREPLYSPLGRRHRPWLIADITVYWFYLSTREQHPPRVCNKQPPPQNLHFEIASWNRSRRWSSVRAVTVKILLFNYRVKSHFLFCHSIPLPRLDIKSHLGHFACRGDEGSASIRLRLSYMYECGPRFVIEMAQGAPNGSNKSFFFLFN